MQLVPALNVVVYRQPGPADEEIERQAARFVEAKSVVDSLDLRLRINISESLKRLASSAEQPRAAGPAGRAGMNPSLEANEQAVLSIVFDQSWNGSRIKMVSSRSGLVDKSVTGHSISSSIVLTYFTACAGSSAQLRAPRVDCVQPSNV